MDMWCLAVDDRLDPLETPSFPRGSGSLPICSDELESRLQAALWRHLDPNKDGHTDLLTMTVFFHVLMGAVDDAAQGASRSAALEETVASPSKSTASEGGSLALQSINEENTAEISNPASAVISTSQGAPQEEGRRIVELLLRFDPIRLRSEFQPLYTHRMHYQAQQEKAPEKKDDAIVVNPAIDSKSRAMADELLKKQKGESGSLTHAELLLWRHRKTQEKKEELRSKIRIEEVSGCTFRPKCNPPKPKEGHVEILTPAGSTRAEVLYERGLADKRQREQKVRESEKAKTTEEVRGCTFQPNLSKSVKSYTKASEAPTKVPKGFYETRQRIRAAYEVREKVLQQREDRMARIEATVPYQAGKGHQGPRQVQWSYSEDWQDHGGWYQDSWNEGQAQSSQWTKSPRRRQSPRRRVNKKGTPSVDNPKGKGKSTQEAEYGPPSLASLAAMDPPWKPVAPVPPPTVQPIQPPPQEDKQLRSILATLKKHTEVLPPEVQAIVNEVALKDGQHETKQLHSAVAAHGRARKELQHAQLARHNLHAAWRNFLGQAVSQWQSYGEQFIEQERQMTERVTSAMQNLEQAKDSLAKSKSSAGVDSRDDTNASDEEMDCKKEVSNAAADRIKETLSGLQANLEAMKTSAEQMVEEEQHALKRPRIEVVPETKPVSPPDGTGFG
eukprot:s1969_g6.t1